MTQTKKMFNFRGSQFKLQFLKTCENILVIKDGNQAALGNYQSITNTGFDIEEILKSYNAEIKEKDSKTPL